MTRTQIQLPDSLYKRAKKFAEQREMSLAEVTRRGLEMLLDRFPEGSHKPKRWSIPKIHSGGIKVPLAKLKDIADSEQAARSHR